MHRCYVFHNRHYKEDPSETKENAHNCIQCGCPFGKHTYEDKIYWFDIEPREVTDKELLGNYKDAKSKRQAAEKKILEDENKCLVLQIECMIAHIEV